ncbi:uncharacterized protein LOC131018973 [Salvia miltiorrhiza]|uniref:uncharacterized protein LOC131018973 n=1 Tax=Salvia miltiorrhiza TaxID=226208 RepID=UPI0025ACA273|nr:uncharacterized protein LOC131018973 [Salvia miltiorrhiza]
MSRVEGNSVSNEIGREKASKGDKSRRSWTIREKEVLLASLKELVVQGFKSDNGFRAGYLGKLEEALKSFFPGTDLKGMPHVHSKLSTWKRNYSSLSTILEKTGVGFNVDGKYMIDCDKVLWEQIVMEDSNARPMLSKRWPYWEDWKEIFGKDRASGKKAEDVMDAINEVHHGRNQANDKLHGDYYVHVQDEVEQEGVADSACQSEKSGVAARSTSKKRKVSDGFERLLEFLGEMGHDSKTRIDSIASRIGYKFDLAKARKEVYDQLNGMPNLDTKEKFYAYEILAGETQGLELFMGLPDDAKPQYVAYLLDTKRQ